MKIRNSVETDSLVVNGLIREKIQVINMADGQIALLTSGTPTSGQVLLAGTILAVDAESSGTEKLLLPPASAAIAGLRLTISNSGGESILLRTSADEAIVTIPTGRTCQVFCSGAGWGYSLGVTT